MYIDREMVKVIFNTIECNANNLKDLETVL